MENKYLSLKELEETINLEEFTKDFCSADALDYDKLSEKYNGSERNLKYYAGAHKLRRSQAFINNKRAQNRIAKYGEKAPKEKQKTEAKPQAVKKQSTATKYRPVHVTDADYTRKAKSVAQLKSVEEFAKLLDNNGIEYSKDFDIDGAIYDFKIGNILIEIDPSTTHNSTPNKDHTEFNKEYHRNKSILAANNGYTCIHVFDWDKSEKVANMLKPKTNIYARKCEVRVISDGPEYREFINANHLQGYCKGNKIIVGLYYNNVLVEALSIGTPRYNKNYQYEILRLCSDASYSVNGGTEKIFKYFIEKYNPESVITYCDSAKFSGKVYHKLGFTLLKNAKGSKHWFNITTGQHVTDNLLRQRGFDQLFDANFGKGTSNEELMRGIGFVEIFDCGQNTFVWKREE